VSELVRRGLVSDVDAARRAVSAGEVTVSGAPALNPSRLVGDDEPLGLVRPNRFVSRGGEKLDGALADLGVDVRGRRVLDLGSSTGGFTDCVLQRGAAGVVAVDVGRALLHERILGNPRVTVAEGVHVRDVASVVDLATIDLVVADLSFISACSAIEATAAGLAPGCELVILVKPQFEAPRSDVDRGSGVVTDPKVVESAVERVRDCAVRAGLEAVAVAPSRTPGRRGNVEYFLHLRRPASF
jgi:23S rRNA (cytidine1920-2'-O)/16S rRNA (cytidine1409-2'-O)-methyltransferase